MNYLRLFLIFLLLIGLCYAQENMDNPEQNTSIGSSLREVTFWEESLMDEDLDLYIASPEEQQQRQEFFDKHGYVLAAPEFYQN
jgi:hypothetical protein